MLIQPWNWECCCPGVEEAPSQNWTDIPDLKQRRLKEEETQRRKQESRKPDRMKHVMLDAGMKAAWRARAEVAAVNLASFFSPFDF